MNKFSTRMICNRLPVFILLVCLQTAPQFVCPSQAMIQVVPPAMPKDEIAAASGSRFPGSAANGVEDLKRIYQLIAIYRRSHAGNFPSKTSELFSEISRSPTTYGFTTFVEAFRVLSNPDSRYADSLSLRKSPENSVPYVIFGSSRYDGNSIGSPKPTGTRDVLAYTDLYYHANSVHLSKHRTIMNPMGFYLVLWDDGEVEKVPYDQLLYVPGAHTDFSYAFPGQSGVPATYLSYDEYWHNVARLNKVPRGKPAPEGETEPVPDNGGPEALIALSRLLGTPLERERMWEVLDIEKSDFSLQDIQSGAANLNMALQFQKLTLDQLRQYGGPAILQVRDPDQLIALSALDEKYSIVYEGGVMCIVDNETLAKRYSGTALIAGNASAAASLRVQDPVREVTVQDTAQEIAQTVTLSNRSAKSVTLVIEHPIPGVTVADLSSDTVAPGKSAALNLKLKWRTILPGKEQTIIVTLRTDDRLQPRLQLAFNLKLSATAALMPGPEEAALLPRAEADPTAVIAPTIPRVEVGKAAPDFMAMDMNGRAWRLLDLKGKKNLLLTFFPRCFTGGCANHLSSLRDQQAAFDAADTQILAVSVDPAEGERGQKAFAAQWQLKFPLIPDEKRELSKLFGAAQNDNQLAARMSVLIDKGGIVRWIDTNISAQTHGTDILAKMRELRMVK